MSTNPAMFVPGTGLPTAVQGVLEAIDLEEGQIKRIVAILEEYSQAIRSAEPGAVRSGAYGGGATGQSLGHHTDLAHQHVVRAMSQMVDTLSGTGERVIAAHKNIQFSDEESGAAGTRLQRRADGVPVLPSLVPTRTAPSSTKRA